MATIGHRIIASAFEILENCPDGVRYSELVRQVAATDPSSSSTPSTGMSGILIRSFPMLSTSPPAVFSV